MQNSWTNIALGDPIQNWRAAIKHKIRSYSMHLLNPFATEFQPTSVPVQPQTQKYINEWTDN